MSDREPEPTWLPTPQEGERMRRRALRLARTSFVIACIALAMAMACLWGALK